jgi:imidazolonepropionase-like amidohydrolase
MSICDGNFDCTHFPMSYTMTGCVQPLRLRQPTCPFQLWNGAAWGALLYVGLALAFGMSGGRSFSQAPDPEQVPSATATPEGGSVAASAPTPPKATLALVNGHILTMEGTSFANGVLLIAGDRILAVGDEKLEVPEGVAKIDASGLTLLPGLIDAQSRLWMSDAADDGGASDGSHRAVDSLDPFNEEWKELIESGVTSVYVQPSSRGAMSGLGATVSAVPKADGTLLIHSSASALQMSFGSAKSNRDRSQRFEAIKKSLQSIVDYKKKWDEYNAYQKKQEELEKTKAASENPKESAKAESPSTNGESAGAPSPDANRGPPGRGPRSRSGGMRRDPAEGERPVAPVPPPAQDKPVEPAASKTGEADAAKEKAPSKPELDPVKERLLAVLSGGIPVRLEIQNANDTRYADLLSEAFPEVQWIFELTADFNIPERLLPKRLLSQRRPPLVLGPWLDLSLDRQRSQQRLTAWRELLQDSSGIIAIGTGERTGRASRSLRENAAVAVASGVDPVLAMEGITTHAARLLGVSEHLGSLAAGKRADIIGIAGDPLDTSAPVTLVVVGGTPSPTRASPQRQLASASPSTASMESFESLPSRYRLRSQRVLLPDGLKPATLTIEGGKIANIEAWEQGDASQEPQLFEVGDAMITPGLFSCHATLALNELTQGGSDSDSLAVAASDISIRNTPLRSLLQSEGVYSLGFATGSKNPMAGQISMVSTNDAASVLLPATGAKIVLNESSRRADRFPSSLAGQVKLVRDTFEGKIPDSRLYLPSETLERWSRLKQELAQRVQQRELPAVFEITEDAELDAALDLIERYRLRAALFGAKEWKPRADRIRALNVAIIAKPFDTNSYSREATDLLACHLLDIPIGFSGDTGLQMRATASAMVRAGMPPEPALQALVLGSSLVYGLPQEQLGVRVGLPADVVVWSDSPLNLSSRPLVAIRGGLPLSLEVKP